MKTILKSLVIAIFFVGLVSTSYAQKAATAPASAEILQDLTITLDGTLNAINFGRVSSTTPGAIVLDANTAASNVNTGTVTNVAQFDLGGANGGVFAESPHPEASAGKLSSRRFRGHPLRF